MQLSAACHPQRVLTTAGCRSLLYCHGNEWAVCCRFLKWLARQASPDVASVMEGMRFSILGLGSSCYPRFCAAADLFDSMLLAAGELPPTCWQAEYHLSAGCGGWLLGDT